MFTITAATHQGKRPYQEDASFHFQNEDGAFVVVCDGVGGSDRGADASMFAVNFFREIQSELGELLKVMNHDFNLVRLTLEKLVMQCHIDLALNIRGHRRGKEPCTTLVCGFITTKGAVCASVGDSYIYSVDSTHPIPTMMVNKLDETSTGAITQAVGGGIHKVNTYVFDWKQTQLVFATDGLTILPTGGDAPFLVNAQLDQKLKAQDNVTVVVVNG